MSSFPGAIYDGQGMRLDPTIPDLLQEHLDGCQHRSMLTDRTLAPVARVWLLANDATPDAIPPILMTEAVRLILAGKGIVILGRRLEPAVDVQDGLLDALEAIVERGDIAGHS